MKSTNIPQHIQDKANQMLAKGAKMTFEAICEMYMKSEAKATKPNDKKWKQRELVSNTKASANASAWLAEKNKENALNNLPSSLR
jgi:hypothetical protein